MRRSVLLVLVPLAAAPIVATAAVGTALTMTSRSARAGKASLPTVTGPVTGGAGHPTIVSTSFDLGQVGYVSGEYFLSGTATAFSSAQPLTADGKWRITPTSSAPYTTRLLVYRPADPKKFNGTVVVEWLNVSAGFETAPDWQSAHNELIREGSAWIGVSAQSVGVQGGTGTVGGVAPGGLKNADPARYASLSHPGDSYSYDIFSQAGLAARHATTAGALGGLKVRRVIGAGESQSAFGLVTYINGVQPLAHAYDGFLVFSRGGSGSNLSRAPLPVITVPVGTVIRSDLTVPVLTLETESDLVSPEIGYLPARQADTSRFRLWEVAGTAHADVYSGGGGFADIGDGAAERVLLDVGAVTGGPLGCAKPINDGPAYLVENAALYYLNRWVSPGPPPPRARRLEVNPGPPAAISRDAHGNALGGIRTPVVDVPLATLRGDGNTGGIFCALFGTTTPFDAATVAALYPTHAAFVTKFDHAADEAATAGFLLPVDVRRLKAAAAASSVGS
jgi:hypothetical protein